MTRRVDPAGRPSDPAAMLVGLLMSLSVYHRSLVPQHHLSVGQYIGLRFVEANAPVRISELARSALVSRPTATAFVDVMERKGWVHRARSADDRRAVVLELTPKAHRTLRQIDSEQARFFEQAFARLPRDRQRRATIWLREMGSAIEAELTSHGVRTCTGSR